MLIKNVTLSSKMIKKSALLVEFSFLIIFVTLFIGVDILLIVLNKIDVK